MEFNSVQYRVNCSCSILTGHLRKHTVGKIRAGNAALLRFTLPSNDIAV